MKRLFDMLLSSAALVVLSPALLVIVVVVAVSSRGGAFFHQTRVGRHGVDFKLHKFRTMRTNAEADGQLSMGSSDQRITSTGHFLRRSKLDELPQLWNVLVGEMSIVGPRPEVRKYVAMYTEEQLRVLSVRPGLTSKASLEYLREGELIAASSDPEKTYIKEVMPDKLALDLKYVENAGLITDTTLIFRTVFKIFQ